MKLFNSVAVVCDWKMIEEAIAIRAVLESFRLRVHFYRLVQRRNAIDFFAGKCVPECDYTVLVCHGMGSAEDPRIRIEVVDKVAGDVEAPEGREGAPFDLSPKNIPGYVTGGRGTLVCIGCGSGR